MSESTYHHQLVEQIKKSIEDIVPKDCWGLICYDSFSSIVLPPQFLGGYRPDVYYEFGDLLLIGEAKTSKDVEKRHSREQYETYIKACAAFQGYAMLFLAVPWMEQATAHNILGKIKKGYPGKYTTKVLVM
jgi:hypothetical protein